MVAFSFGVVITSAARDLLSVGMNKADCFHPNLSKGGARRGPQSRAQTPRA
jgi:hypothetical protein